MKVLKFGSVCLGSADRMKQVSHIVSNTPGCIVILSAMEETTQALEDISNYLYRKNIEGANEIINRLEARYLMEISGIYSTEEAKTAAIEFVTEKINYVRSFTKDLFTLFEERIVLAQGELLSSGIFHLLLVEQGIDAKLIQAADFMRTDKNKEPDPVYIKEKLTGLLAENPDAAAYVTQGYICRNAYGEIDDLRSSGGSDYTASLVGAAINAEEIQIWTDSDRMQNNNPAYVHTAKPIEQLSFDEAAELAYFGDKILHPTCVLPAKMANVPVRLLNMLEPQAQGTLISNKLSQGTIKAVAAKDGIIAIQIKSGRMLLAHGFLRKVFEVFDFHQTSIDMIVTSEVGVSVTIDNDRYLKEILDDLKKFGTVSVDKDMALICVVGDLDWHNVGFESKVLNAVKTLPVRMISYGGSNFNVSFLVDSKDKPDALRLLNEELF
ncbi:aspartate kinase [Dysgonomonas sp. 520]|uniref:aspartate kinase n=1 Tax=Dysgonomonas sp. 520 TaxID=2302931 RepID=UPI0013D3FBCA|nr:aspartate kinase [Dysgonomonas sp. 520]NDW10656.1 aspartate kinase [Dysgonomonas sp. 520]